MSFESPEAEKSFYEGLPRKRMAAGALLILKDRILVLKPTYKEGWTIPGGTVEDGEAPLQACVREVFEETGLETGRLRFAAVDHLPAIGAQNEFLHFLFAQEWEGEAPELRLPEDEIAEARWVTVEEATRLLTPRLAKRIAPALRAYHAGVAVYLENGARVA
jgi:ADP-ribose pyrophosphatase YjhB (NUDIX family)